MTCSTISLSFNIDRSWRRRAIRALGWERSPQGTYLDLCAGTLDVGSRAGAPAGLFGARRSGSISPSRCCARGAGKAAARGRRAGPRRRTGAATRHGVGGRRDRGVRDPERGRSRCGACRSAPRRRARGSLRHPRVHDTARRRRAIGLSRILSSRATRHRRRRQRSADWRIDTCRSSVAYFPTASELAAHMRRAGFASVRWDLLTLGVAALHVGER